MRLTYLIGAWLTAIPAMASQPIVYSDFADLSAFTLNGAAAAIQPDGAGTALGEQRVLRLTTAEEGQSGGAFLKHTVSLAANASFSSAFSFEIRDPGGHDDVDGPGADGLAFVVQTQSDTVGGDGRGIGYGGIEPAVAIEFDTFDNERQFGPNGDVNGNHVGLNLNGDITSEAQQAAPWPLNQGGVLHAWVEYDGESKTIEVRLAREPVRPAQPLLTHRVDLLQVLGQPEVYVGFTASTGLAWNVHDILAWQFVGEYRREGLTTVPVDRPRDQLHRRNGDVLQGLLLGYDDEVFEFRTIDDVVHRVPRVDTAKVIVAP